MPKSNIHPIPPTPKKDETITTSIKKYIEYKDAIGDVPEYSQSDVAFAMWVDWLRTQSDQFKSVAVITHKFYHAYVPIYAYSIKKKISLHDWKIFQDVYQAVKILGITDLIDEFDRIQALIPKSVIKSLNKELKKEKKKEF